MDKLKGPDDQQNLSPSFTRRKFWEFLAGAGLALSSTKAKSQERADIPAMPAIEELLDTQPGTREDRLRLVGELVAYLQAGRVHRMRPSDRTPVLPPNTTTVMESDDGIYFATRRPFWRERLSASITLTQRKNVPSPEFNVRLQIRRHYTVPLGGVDQAPLIIGWDSANDTYFVAADQTTYARDNSEGATELRSRTALPDQRSETPSPEEKVILDRLFKGLLLKIIGTG